MKTTSHRTFPPHLQVGFLPSPGYEERGRGKRNDWKSVLDAFLDNLLRLRRGRAEIVFISLKDMYSQLSYTLTMRLSGHQSCCSCKFLHSRDSPFLQTELVDSKVLKKIPSAVLGRNWWLRRGKHWRQGFLWRREKCSSAGKYFKTLFSAQSGLSQSKSIPFQNKEKL